MRDMINDRAFAEAEFERFADAHRIDVELEGLDENDQRDKRNNRAVCIAAIRRGELLIEDDGTPVVKLPDGEEMRWGRPTAYALLAMDKKKSSSEAAKFFASLAAITGWSEVKLQRMETADLKLCQALWTLFLA